MPVSSNEDKIVITSMGHYHPKNDISNKFFEELDIGSDTNWVLDRTGIESRRSVLTEKELIELKNDSNFLSQLRKNKALETIAEMGGKSFSVLKERVSSGDTSLEDEIDCLICGTSVPDWDIPANAATISANIGVKATSFDVNSACSSFIVDLHVARGLINSGQNNCIGIFNPERYSLRLNYNDKKTCILFGDGCSSALVKKGNNLSGLEVLDTVVTSDPSKFETVSIPVDGLFDQNGKAVQKFAITKTISTVDSLLKRNNLNAKDLSYFIGHQANLRMITSASDRLGLNPSKHLYNVDKFGNQGAAGAPCVLSMNWERFQPGDLIAVAVVGSGLTWGGALLRKN